MSGAQTDLHDTHRTSIRRTLASALLTAVAWTAPLAIGATLGLEPVSRTAVDGTADLRVQRAQDLIEAHRCWTDSQARAP